MNPKVVPPMFGSRDSDFAILPGLVGRRRKQRSLLSPEFGQSVVSDAILLETGGLILLESGGSYIALE